MAAQPTCMQICLWWRMRNREINWRGLIYTNHLSIASIISTSNCVKIKALEMLNKISPEVIVVILLW